MKKFGVLVLCCMLLLAAVPLPACAAERQNDYPIVFVHGFMGWGRNEMCGVKYWGGLRDIQEDLNKQGYRAYTAAVGPISSDWDRTCELYAQIKGGTVDYGKVHSQKYGHARYGRTYPGLYPEWGTVDSSGRVRKIHLIGHSMGGLDIRMLTQLLAEGSEEERNGTDPGDLSPLFAGGKNWVASVTTISSPNDLPENTHTYLNEDWAINFIEAVAALAGSNINSVFYDFKLDQWGLHRQPGESLLTYFKRVCKSNFWNSEDVSLEQISPEYVRNFNAWAKARPDVYYFSWATEATRTDPKTGYEVPEASMNPLWIANSYNLGRNTNVDRIWWQNDGAGSTYSSIGPRAGSTDVIVNFDGSPKIGVWNFMGILDHIDHTDVIGLLTSWNPLEFYRTHAQLLASLPPVD